MKKKYVICIIVSVVIVLVGVATGVLYHFSSDEYKIKKAIISAENHIKEYRQDQSAFADTLMFYLPSSCVYDEDDYHIVLKNKHYIYNKKSVSKSKQKYVVFDTLNMIKESDLIADTTVYTLGYNTKFDGGGAKYEVASHETQEVYIKIGDMYLNYVSNDKKINTRQLGWDNTDFNDYQAKFEKLTTINTLMFIKGEYPLNDCLRTARNNVNYYGLDAIIYSKDGFGGVNNKSFEAVWNVGTKWPHTVGEYVIGQNYSGLKFENRTKTLNPDYTDLHGADRLMQIAYCKNINIYNCAFVIPQGLHGENLSNYAAGGLDCYTDWHDIIIDKCSFENYSYANYGGAVGFRDLYNRGCDNMTFTNNYVVSSPRDEGVAIFAGHDKNLNPSATYGDGYIRNVTLKNNQFKALEVPEELAPRTMFLTVGYQLTPVYDIKYLDNTFDGYCNSFFMSYGYAYGLTFKNNTVNIRQTGNNKKMTLIWHGESPEAGDILIEQNQFNLIGDNFQLNSVAVSNANSDISELTFRNNIINLDDGYAETIIGSNATFTDNTINAKSVGSIYYRSNGIIKDNIYNIGALSKAIFEFYNMNVQKDIAVKNEIINVETMTSNMLSFNGSIKFNDHSLLFEDVNFNINQVVDKKYYYLSWSSNNITDTVVPITFRRCTFGAFDGHLVIPNGDKHEIIIE